MSLSRIGQDRARFKDIVRGRLRSDLRRYLTSSELFGRRGDHAVSIPIPQIELPRLRHGDGPGDGRCGEGGGEGEPAEGGEPRPGQGGGEAGEGAGEHILEVDVELEELAELLGRELGLPRIEPRGDRALRAAAGRWSGLAEHGPRSLRHFKRTWRNAFERAVASGAYDPDAPLVLPEPRDERFRRKKVVDEPQAAAVVFHVMDVSGSMGREQKEIVRVKAFWIDTWLRSQYEQLEVVYIVHDAVAKVVDQHSFFHLRESGGTKISSAYEVLLEELRSRWRPEDWNIYPFHYSDGDNWSARDTERCIALLRDEILPRCNQFCYGQVKSAYGSGQFKKDLDLALPGEDKLVSVALDGREDVPDAIRAFLGRGR